MLMRSIIVWASLAGLLGFSLGGSFVWSLQETKLASHGYETFFDHMPEWFVAVFTGLLTVVTFLLVRSTNRLWEAGERQIVVAEKATNAAVASAEFIPRVERAYLTGGGPVLPPEAAERFFRVEVANYGKTPAFLCAYDVQFATLEEK
jgi:hypothetical protein